MTYVSTVSAMGLCPCVCLSFCHNQEFYQNGYIYHHTISVAWQPGDSSFLGDILIGSPPTGVPNAGGEGKNWVFQLVQTSPTRMPYCQKFAFIRYDGPCWRWCAGRAILPRSQQFLTVEVLFVMLTAHLNVTFTLPGRNWTQQSVCSKHGYVNGALAH